MNKILSILFLFFHLQAHAFTEAYSLFNQQEFATINRPELVDGEYYSDQLAFRHSLINDYNFLTSKNAFDLYVGSISSKQFTSEKRLKLAQDISPHIQFDLVYIEKENFELARQQFLTGLTFKLSQVISLSTYAGLFYDKDKNDIGAALNFKINSIHTIRFFINQADFDFNARNAVKAEDKKSSTNYGVVGTVLTEDFEFLQYYAFKNTPLVRDFLDEEIRYNFEETRVGLRGRKQLSTKNDFLNFDVEFFQRSEGQFAITTPDPTNDQNWDVLGYRVLGQWQRDVIIVGLEHNYRKWESQDGGGVVRHNNWMPHIWYGWRWPSHTYFPSGLDLGLEGSFHLASGEQNLRSKTDEDEAFNGRFNLRTYFDFSKTAKLNLLLSLDLDDLSWEGGGGQFQILF